jgi:hypothetical protein
MEIMAAVPDTTIQGFNSKAKPCDASFGATQQNIVCGQEDLRAGLLRARQVQRVKSTEPLSFDIPGTIGNLLVWNDHFVGEEEQSLSVPPAFWIWVAAHLDAQNGAAHPRRMARTNNAHDVFYGLGLGPDARLILIIGEATEATGIQIDSQ